ncbi:MAG: response regulator [Bacteroidales bacterium]|nr:response regulator [Bacteroidales bacterium]
MTRIPLTILLLEDEAIDAGLIREQLLAMAEYDCEIIWTKDKPAFLAALESKIPDLILSDYNLANFSGLDALNCVSEKKMLVPFIFVTGAIDEETAAETIKAGAWDYVVKDRLLRLPLAIRGALQLREEKSNALKAALESRKLLKAMEHSPVHIIMMNVNHEIEYVNKRYTETTGYALEDLKEKDSWRFVLHNLPEKYFSDLQRKNIHPYNWHGEIKSKKKDGTDYWESVSISPLMNEENQVTHYIIVKEDITPRKRIIQELINARNKAERSDKLKDAFLQNLSHEIRTPLNAIVGFSSLLEESSGLPDELKEYTSIILSSSNQLLSIVNDILTISRIQTGQEIITTSEVYVNSILDDMYLIFKSQASQNKIEYAVVKGNLDRDFHILIDETKLVQILTNLLNNAFKYTHEGSVTCGYTFKKDRIEFFVKDTGIGISPENQKIIFDRFRQADTSFNRNYGGTGLGLSISKSFAEMLGGQLWVESKQGEGSTFFLSLPCRTEKGMEAHLPWEETPSPKKEITILDAEDEKHNFRLIQAYLNDACIKLIHAANGLEAVNISQTTSPIDLILMDIKMPEMDGISAMLEIRKSLNVPIIAQTAYALEHEKQQLLKIGFSDYISKPLKREELVEKVYKFTD